MNIFINGKKHAGDIHAKLDALAAKQATSAIKAPRIVVSANDEKDGLQVQQHLRDFYQTALTRHAQEHDDEHALLMVLT